jgi:hypothetical protein
MFFKALLEIGTNVIASSGREISLFRVSVFIQRKKPKTRRIPFGVGNREGGRFHLLK